MICRKLGISEIIWDIYRKKKNTAKAENAALAVYVDSEMNRKFHYET